MFQLEITNYYWIRLGRENKAPHIVSMTVYANQYSINEMKKEKKTSWRYEVHKTQRGVVTARG